MKYQILSLNIGEPTKHIINGKELHTGFIKTSVNHPIWLSKTGFEGDGQADMKNHGGEDKALLMYPYQHYNYWQERYNRKFQQPSFGENITVEDLTEENVHLGDIYTIGEAVVQVSQPRQPCYKIAEVHQIKDIPAVVTETGFSGYYFRVLQEGYVSPDDQVELIEEDTSKISISFVQETLFHQRENTERIKQILSNEAIAPSLRKTFEKRLKAI
ncbi:MOSC domain-containing protein [Aquibacillus albus]|uniref:MOSC domain-containing protein YiiM n=1 Tax=Aquibacillus albus TaxID=1168171 RepID=A0ABS2N2R5_9BACI|nr:MOSC domain-containing protein [Aquibacillus albus]MBM7572411.1 MOSC domain-containing protein YiiM [Aquibacillus albus]